MLNDSKDLLNLVIAFCILWLTVFICWLIYYVALIFKGFHQVVEKFNQTLETINSFFTNAKEKVEHLGANFAMIIEAARKISEFIRSRKKQPVKKQK